MTTTCGRRRRTAACGGCGLTMHRTTAPVPKCEGCRAEERLARADPLAHPPESKPVNVREAQLRRLYEAVEGHGIRRAVRRFARLHGRRPTAAERRRLEWRTVRWLERRGLPTTVDHLPKAFEVQGASDEAIRRVVRMARRAAAHAVARLTGGCHAVDGRAADAGGVGEWPAGVAGGGGGADGCLVGP